MILLIVKQVEEWENKNYYLDNREKELKMVIDTTEIISKKVLTGYNSHTIPYGSHPWEILISN